MKVSNHVTKAMMDWIDDGCEFSGDGKLPCTADMRGLLRTLFSRKGKDEAVMALKTATLSCCAFDVAAGGDSVIAMRLLTALINDDDAGIDWSAIVDKYKTCHELN